MSFLIALIVAVLLVTGLAFVIAGGFIMSLSAVEQSRDIQSDVRDVSREILAATRETQAEMLRAIIEQRRRGGPR